MPITELLPYLKGLSHDDKLLLLHFLVGELLEDSGLIPLDAQDKAANEGLRNSFEAAAILAKALAEEKATKNG
ncbi:MAG: hypothetical protein KME64_18420 [Scytonematopsis contorta HA4267-MV1]|jgi:hypothetical protein|nr:hypothetical protein [Scytonematopsis contorta HA4267-MV1]